MPSQRTLLAITAAFGVGIALACFWPLLDGGFLFDDFANLPALGEYGPINDSAALLRYLTAGIADPLGRPVAMASFLLDARDWPTDPRPLLRTNLLLHVGNGLLLGALLLRLGNFVSRDGRVIATSAVVGAALWCLHPLWVSTVGYVVQRHALMATTFVLLGLLAWLMAVECFRKGNSTRAWLFAAAAMPLCGLLAALSKANGMLLPVLALSLQYFVLAPSHHGPAPERRAARLLLALPSVLLVLALLWMVDPRAPTRAWTLGERLMSQPRAIADYLLHLGIPRVNSPGLFADGFQVSTGWLTPFTTLPALIFLVGLVMAPFLLRRRAPAVAAALAFFLAGHLMESTVLPLELYFEHRNYLPAMLLGWGLSLGLLGTPRLKSLGKVLLLGYLLVLPALSYQRAQLWADEARQAVVWGNSLPDSPRAQTWAAQQELAIGHHAAARDRLEAALLRHPANPMLSLNLVSVECTSGAVKDGTLQTAAEALAASGTRLDMNYAWLRNRLLDEQPRCPGLDASALDDLVGAVLEHPSNIPRAAARNHRLQALLSLTRQDCVAASSHLAAALASQKRDAEAFGDIALLASRCGPDRGLRLLERYRANPAPTFTERAGMPRIHARVLEKQGYWQAELERLEAALRTDAAINHGQ